MKGVVLLLLLFFPGAAAAAGSAPLFWRGPVADGSEAGYDPFAFFVHYTLDTLQVPASFDTADLGDRFDRVRYNLSHPAEAIETTGGWGEFVHRQIVPLKSGDLWGSKDMLPNYVLHLLGGGMLYRKDAEWFAAHGVRWPRLTSAALAMTAEIAQEVIEKKTTEPDDEVADVYLFRPLGMLLFAHDGAARFLRDELELAPWPSQPLYNASDGTLRNAGLSFALRPPSLSRRGHGLFVLAGIATYVGMSHPLGNGDRISWGVGEAVTYVTRGALETRLSAALFVDREGSLLWSAGVDTTDGWALRVNLYPGQGRPGWFVGVEDDGAVLVGVTTSLSPIGMAGRVIAP